MIPNRFRHSSEIARRYRPFHELETDQMFRFRQFAGRIGLGRCDVCGRIVPSNMRVCLDCRLNGDA